MTSLHTPPVASVHLDVRPVVGMTAVTVEVVSKDPIRPGHRVLRINTPQVILVFSLPLQDAQQVGRLLAAPGVEVAS